MNDLQIINLYLDRNEAAIAETQKKYGKYCFAVANNILDDRRDSEECVNETWLKTWESIPPQMPDVFRLFLAKITRNLALNKLKKDTRQKRGSNELPLALDELSEVVSCHNDTEKEFDRKQLAGSINKFLESLKDRDATVFVRRYFYLDSTRSIARLCHISEDNVLKILSRTRQKLKDHLESEGYVI